MRKIHLSSAIISSISAIGVDTILSEVPFAALTTSYQRQLVLDGKVKSIKEAIDGDTMVKAPFKALDYWARGELRDLAIANNIKLADNLHFGRNRKRGGKKNAKRGTRQNGKTATGAKGRSLKSLKDFKKKLTTLKSFDFEGGKLNLVVGNIAVMIAFFASILRGKASRLVSLGVTTNDSQPKLVALYTEGGSKLDKVTVPSNVLADAFGAVRFATGGVHVTWFRFFSAMKGGIKIASALENQINKKWMAAFIADVFTAFFTKNSGHVIGDNTNTILLVVPSSLETAKTCRMIYAMDDEMNFDVLPQKTDKSVRNAIDETYGNLLVQAEYLGHYLYGITAEQIKAWLCREGQPQWTKSKKFDAPIEDISLVRKNSFGIASCIVTTQATTDNANRFVPVTLNIESDKVGFFAQSKLAVKKADTPKLGTIVRVGSHRIADIPAVDTGLALGFTRRSALPAPVTGMIQGLNQVHTWNKTPEFQAAA